MMKTNFANGYWYEFCNIVRDTTLTVAEISREANVDRGTIYRLAEGSAPCRYKSANKVHRVLKAKDPSIVPNSLDQVWEESSRPLSVKRKK